MRRLYNVLLILAVLGLCMTAAAQDVYRSHMLVRVYAESEARLVELHRYTNLDLVPGDQRDQPNLVASPEDLPFLQLHGYRYEIVHEDLEQFYANRLQNATELMGGYKTYVEIQAAMDSIHAAHPAIATAKWSIGATLEGRQQWVMLITNLADSSNPKPEVFYNSLIHAREPEAMECSFYFMNWLTNNYGTDPEATYLVNNRRLYFLPCVNPDGYVYNQTTNPNGGGMWRKNRHVNGDGSYGVDCNRNFGLYWGADNNGSSPIGSDETYRGTAGFSELETQHLRDFINSRHFVTEMDYHTYQDDILYPWGTSYFPPPSGTGFTTDNATFQMIADSIQYFIQSVNGVTYVAGPSWQVLYDVNGGSFDWEYGDTTSHQKIYAFTVEVGNTSDGFWPPTNRILPLAQENLPALIFLARIAGPLQPCPVQPVAAVTPPSVTGQASVGGTDTQTLHICNNGGCHLTWGVTFSQTTPLTTSVATVPAMRDDIVITKDGPDMNRGRDQLDNQGGPDGFGYRWKDSNEANGPVYNWVEIRSVGTRMNITTDDQIVPVTLPWAFPYYGSTFTTANVSANGNIHFSADTLDYGNRGIPSRRLPNAMICPFWDDLSPQLATSPGGVWYYNDAANNRFIVQYDSVPHFSSLVGRYTFEAILYSTGRIVFQYQSLSGALNSCTVGIENLDGSDGLQVVFNAAYLANNLAIEFKAVTPWLSFGGATSGSLDTLQCTDVTLNFTAGTLPAGNYSGQISVQTNDPTHYSIVVPVTFAIGQLTPPQGLVLYRDFTTDMLVLTWESSGAAHYNVYSGTSVEGPFNTLVGSTTATTLTIPLPPDLLLFYQVVSSDQ